MLAKARHAARRCARASAAVIVGDQVARCFCHSPLDEEPSDARSTMLARGARWPEGVALEEFAMLLQAEAAWKQAGSRGGEVGLCAAVRKSNGFSLRCGTSSVSDGGNGVFAEGDIPEGRIVTACCGSWRAAWDTVLDRMLRVLMPTFRNGEYLFCQADGSSVDGVSQSAEHQRQTCGYVRPSACGQLLNHPSKGATANTAKFAVRMPCTQTFETLCMNYPTVWRSAPMLYFFSHHTVTLLLTTEKIRDGQELFMDYGFVDDFPPWYSPCTSSPPSRAPRSLTLGDFLANEDSMR